MIEAQGLVKTFRDKNRGEVRAVDHVNFCCRPGEIFDFWAPTAREKPRPCAYWQQF